MERSPDGTVFTRRIADAKRTRAVIDEIECKLSRDDIQKLY
jgi:hypothetical protein